MSFSRLFIAVSAVTIAAACDASTQTTPSQKSWRISVDGNLNNFFDCLEDAGVAIVSAHRGGPIAGFPENGLETLQATLADAPALMEIDVAQSADGVLFLMHDDKLERTTTGEGEAKEKPWSELKSLQLEDADGDLTDFAPPLFSDVIAWAKDKTVIQIDFKRSASFEKVIDEIYRQNAQNNVILIAYSVDAAKKLHRLAPDMMISLSLSSQSALNTAIAAGLPTDRLIAFTGIDEPSTRFYPQLAQRNVEAIFGTLGWRNSIDQQIAESGNDARYGDIAKHGVDIIATDRPRSAHKALADLGLAPINGLCGVSYQ